MFKWLQDTPPDTLTDIRRVFDGFHTEVVPISYTVAGGAKAAERSELIISSWDVQAEPAGLF